MARVTLLPLLVAMSASPRDVKAAPSFCPLAVGAEAKAEMARYSLQAYGSGDPTNGLQALLFVPKPVGTRPLPMVVYIPGNGELGDVRRKFRWRAHWGEMHGQCPRPRRGTWPGEGRRRS